MHDFGSSSIPTTSVTLIGETMPLSTSYPSSQSSDSLTAHVSVVREAQVTWSSLRKKANILTCLLITLCMSSVFGSRADAKNSFLEFVPAETPYLASLEMDDHVKQWMSKDFPILDEAEILMDPNRASRMLGLLAKDLLTHLGDDTTPSLGLPNVTNMKVGLHGLGIWPVLSFALSNQVEFTKWIARSAKKAGLSAQRAGKALVFAIEGSSDLPSAIVVSFPRPNWVSVAFVPDAHRDGMLPYLTGEKSPKVSMERAKMFASWTKEAELSSSYSIYFGIDRFVKSLLGQGLGLNKRFHWINDQLVQSVPPSCIPEYLEIVSAAPYLLAGQARQQPADQFNGKMVWRFSEQVAKVTQSFAAEESYVTPSTDGLVSFSLSMNIKAIIQGIQSFLQYRIQNPYTCPHLAKLGANPQELQMASSKLMLTPPFLFDLRGVSGTLTDIGSVPSGMAAISSKNMMTLIMVAKSMMNPQAAQIKFPPVDGGPQKLEGLPLPPAVEVTAEMKKDALGLSIGSAHIQKVSELLKSEPRKDPPFFEVIYDVSKLLDAAEEYRNMAIQAQKQAQAAQYAREVEMAKARGEEPPPFQGVEEEANPIQMLRDMKMGQLSYSTEFTGLGLEMTFSLDMPAQR